MQDELRARLRVLRDEYTEAVNAAVAEERADLVDELVANYPDAALRLLGDTAHDAREA